MKFAPGARLKRAFRRCIPFALRKWLAIWLNRQAWFPHDHIPVGLVRDLAARDPKEFHKLLWAHHFKHYGQWYDSEEELFSLECMQPSRRLFFADLASVMRQRGLQPSQIRSVLEVGCSQGYLLRHLETEVFPECRQFLGIDIDGTAIRKGKAFLERAGSRVVLAEGDMEHLDRMLGDRSFDLVYAAGVLSYLDERHAAALVANLLGRTGKVLGLAGLACIRQDNRELEHSEASAEHEHQWVHNFAAMVMAAGGSVVASRWEGATLYNLQTICFVFGVPG